MKFRMKRGKSVRKVVRKLFAFHLARCGALLTAIEPSPGRIHEVRKSVKRLRAHVSLVASGLGEDRGWFDRRLRDINRLLSPVRDAESLREAFDRLVTAEVQPPDEFAAVRAVLWGSTDRQERVSVGAVRKVLNHLYALRRRWEKVTLRGRGWSLLAGNLRDARRHCRRHVRSLSTQPSAAELHELRKSVKQVQYQWEFLQPMDPESMTAEIAALEHLSDTLGQHHDYELLTDWLRGESRHMLTENTRQLVEIAARRDQQRLLQSILADAPDVFAESPRDVVRSLQKRWKRWRHEPVLRPNSSHPSNPAVLQNVGP